MTVDNTGGLPERQAPIKC